MRFCNRYVSDVADALGSGNVIAGAASSDLLQALLLVEGYKASELHVTGIDAGVQIRRGQRQAFLRSVRLPRRARAGTRVKAALTLRHVRGKLERRTVKLRLPDDLPPGRRRVVFTGADVDSGEGDLFGLFEFEFEFGGGGGELGPPNLRSLIAAIDGIHRYDGVSARGARSDPEDFDPGLPSYRDPELRISGRARATIKIGGRRAPHRR